MEVLTASQSREADRLAIETRGIPSSVLMENAAKAVVESLKRHVPDWEKKRVAVVVGKGNNGGDGRIVARLLGEKVRVFEATEEIPPAPLFQRGDFDLVVDAVLGTGASRAVEGGTRAAIETINQSGARVLAIDVPSGLSSDTGEPLGMAVKAEVTITMGRPKAGLLKPQAALYVGRLEIAEIGIPADVYQSLNPTEFWVTDTDIAPWFEKRANDTHKGSYGHVLVVGGSENKPGAALLSGRAALRAGAGLATVALPDKAFRKSPLRPPFSPRKGPLSGKGGGGDFLELMYAPLPSHRSGTLAKSAWTKILKAVDGKEAVAMGPGLGVNADTKALVKSAILKIDVPLVLDADALNALSAADLKKRKSPTILTPHPGEMARLTGQSTAKIQRDRVGVARKFAVANGLVLVLKGFRTVTATSSGKVFINSTGNPGMATAGMGDVLTGVIASLIAQGLGPEKAAVAGVYLHGRAGDRVAERLGDRGLLASDVIDEVPRTLREIV
jgi:NAD(P)H-hydrate epimerase